MSDVSPLTKEEVEAAYSFISCEYKSYENESERQAELEGVLESMFPVCGVILRETTFLLGGAMVVDFDWAGKEGEARYPATMNKDINWPEDANPF